MQHSFGVLAVLLFTGCAVGPRFAAQEAMRQVDGDVAVLTLVTRGDDVEQAAAVAATLRREVSERLGRRARTEAQIREAIVAQLEGAALRPIDRRALLQAVDAVDADPVRGLLILRQHRAATVADRDLLARARDLFLRAATEAVARGERFGARALLDELQGWLGDAAAPPEALEVPRAVLALWTEVRARPTRATLYRNALPFRTLLPHGASHLALSTTRDDHLPSDVVEEASRLGTALRLDKVILAGLFAGEPRAYVIDVSTRAVARELALVGGRRPVASGLEAAAR